MTIGPARPDENDNKYHWEWEGRNNRSLQVFFFIKEWSNMNVRQKTDWLTFAQRGGNILESFITSTDHDQCEWTVVKRIDDGGPLVVQASKMIRISGLSDFLASANKKP